MVILVDTIVEIVTLVIHFVFLIRNIMLESVGCVMSPVETMGHVKLIHVLKGKYGTGQTTSVNSGK